MRTLLRRLSGAALGLCLPAGALSLPAWATPLNGLPTSSGINATDTFPVCQLAAGCGPLNPLVAMSMASVLGTVGSTISSATTLAASQNNETLPVTGSGYTITVPGGGSALPAGSRITLAAAAGANVDVCVASGSIWDANSTAPLTASLCASGSAVVLTGGERLEIKAESGGNYLAQLSLSSGGSSSWPVDATQTASYTVLAGDASHIVPMACVAATCSATLPASGTFAAGTQLVVANTSNGLSGPITPVGTPTNNSSCSATSCATATETYTVAAAHDLILLDLVACASSTCTSGTASSVSSISDNLGDSCAKVGGAQQTTGSVIDVELWACPNTSAAGADTFTIIFSGTVYYGGGAISEWAGAALSSPAEAVTSTTGTTAAPAIATSAAPSERGDLVYGIENQAGGWNVAAQTPITPGTTYSGTTPWPGQYLLTHGAASYTLNWTTPSGYTPTADWAGVVAAFKPANPLSVVNLCPGSGTALAGMPTLAGGCVPLVPGATARITVNASGNYLVALEPPAHGVGAVDDATASFTPTLLACYETTDLMQWLTTLTVTLPATLPPGCVMNFIQGGSVAAQMAPASGVTLQSAAGDVHTGGQYTGAFVEMGGSTALFAGTIAP